jgi:crossover junction endodeoxyribonuclease RuvC
LNGKAVLGVDTGAATGAWAAISGTEGVIALGDLPTHKIALSTGRLRVEFDPHGFAQVVRELRPRHAMVETVHGMPRQGVASTFRLGYSAGALYGVLATLEIPVTFCTPQKWQGHHHIQRGPDDAVKRALQLFPSLHSQLARKRDNHRADAILIASYGLAVLAQQERTAA